MDLPLLTDHCLVCYGSLPVWLRRTGYSLTGNFESVCNTWGVNFIEALSYQSNTTLHVGTGTAFFLWYCGDLVNEIINDEWAPCEKTVGGGLF